MMVPRCPDDFEIDLYLDGEMSPEEREALSRHIEICPRCRQRVEAEETFRKVLREIPVIAPPPEYSDHLISMARSWAYDLAAQETSRTEPAEEVRGVLPQLVAWVPTKISKLVKDIRTRTAGSAVWGWARQGFAVLLAAIVVFGQFRLEALGMGPGVGRPAPAGIEILDDAITFVETFSFGEFARHVSELWKAFRTAGADTALIAMKALFGPESLMAIVLGVGFVLVVGWRKRRVRFSAD